MSPDEFLAMVSHELRDTNSPIFSWVEIKSRKPGDVETVVQGIGVVERSARLQAAVISQRLDFSLIKNGGLRLNSRAVELAATVEAAIETMGLGRERAQHSQFICHLSAAPGRRSSRETFLDGTPFQKSAPGA